jgi:hypothetical protein
MGFPNTGIFYSKEVASVSALLALNNQPLSGGNNVNPFEVQ